MFSDKELYQLDYCEWLEKTTANGRTVALMFTPGHGTFLKLTGPDVPLGSIEVVCDGDDVNTLAAALATASFA